MNPTNQEVGGEWDGGNFQILPEGYYKASVKSAEAKTSQAQNRMVEIVLVVEDDVYEGVTIYHHLVFMPDAENFNNKKRRWFQTSAGIPFELNDSNENVARWIVGRKLTIKVKTGKNRDGKEQNEICGVHPYNWMNSESGSESGSGSVNAEPDMDDTFL